MKAYNMADSKLMDGQRRDMSQWGQSAMSVNTWHQNLHKKRRPWLTNYMLHCSHQHI